MKRLTIYAIILFAVTAFTSCKKYLDVKPRDQVIADDLFSTEAGFMKALNGVYLDMTQASTYGGAMTMEMVEVLGQRYSLSDESPYYQLGLYNYTDDKVKDKFGEVWAAMYKHIAAVNKALSQLEVRKEVGTAEHRRWIKGELLGLRAYLHFDILRLYGPVYGTDSLSARIPYYDKFTDKYLPFLPANEVAKHVLNDLDSAEVLLQDDPVITEGRTWSNSVIDNPTWHFRQFRLNVYAVQALKARVYLYTKAKAAAYQYAKKVITTAGPKFPFVDPRNVSGPNPDRLFASELLFALQDINMDAKFQKYFSPSNKDANILAAAPANLGNEYERNDNDPRYTANWVTPAGGVKIYRCFYKYADISEPTKYSFVYHLPMIRISEMYLIAAECESDKATALGYLNAVRKARKVFDAPATATVATELMKEFKREFYGEGQCFFYYKRLGSTPITKGDGSGTTVRMSATQYVLPIPENEILYRN
ncbi:RagB/SusD family nutrient uptake outer membrane protein [Chitinophaga sp. Cy-1792]|uniref:RagB/SusD family nutrient uptake outer membrane protein n=1 Tax=Chitinophaga sp. Cy-1792 TaxID=2608339 RepID=UPI0014244933|nr:RagB/SusD family nutrient uptake outer membrane protein [Chitinophaga sp. Cy-1792]